MLRRIFFTALGCALVSPVFAADIKIATVAPEGSDWMREMREASREIRERTGGRVNVKLYGGGVMGNDKKVLRKMRIGQLHGGVFTSSGLSERYKDIAIYGLPLLFRSQPEVDYVRERLDDRLAEGLREAGLESFGFAGGGFARFMGSTPVRTLADIRGRKVWVPEGDRLSYEAMRAMELSPVVLPVTDVLTGLQTGLLDVIATPPVGAVVLQWHTKVKYVTRMPVAYTMALLAVDGRAFGRLSAADQAVFREVMSGVYRHFDTQSIADNAAAEAALADSGLTFVEPDPADIMEWSGIIADAGPRMGEDGLFTPALLDEINAMLNEFRARPATAQSAAAPVE